MERCLICEQRQGLPGLMSRLGASPICIDCFEHQAERTIDIHDFMRSNDPWDGMSTCVHCFAGDFGYMTLQRYERHITSQMPAIIDQEAKLADEEEELLAGMIGEIKRINREDDFNFRAWEDFEPVESLFDKFKAWVSRYMGSALAH